jgi:hypothetical protein
MSGVTALADALPKWYVSHAACALTRHSSYPACVLTHSHAACALAHDSGSLSSANLLGNSIGVEQARALLKIKDAKPGLTTLCGLSGDETELALSGKNLGPGCVILLAPEMEASGSLSKLIWSGDQWFNTVTMEMEDASQGNTVTMDTTMTEADFSNKHLGASGTMILAAFISSKNMTGKGALSKLDISGNRICGLDGYGIGTYDASGLAALTKSIGNLKELSISNNFLKAEGAKILAPALEANGSLASLNIAYNNLQAEGAKCIAEVLPEW